MSIMALLLLAVGLPSADLAQPPPPPAERNRSGLWIAGIAFSPHDIVSATQQFDTYQDTPNVIITFTEAGRVKFARLQDGQLGQQLEMRVDEEVVSSPVLREIITGNQVTISGAFTVEEAAALARRIAPPR